MTGTLRALASSRAFKNTVLVVILLAGVVVGLETVPAIASRHAALLAALNSAVIAIFLVELLIRIGAHGRHWRDFFKDGWNVFDTLVVVATFLPLGAGNPAVVRLLRLLRLLRLATAVPRLQLLISALLRSFSNMGYVVLLLLLLFYIYGVLGVTLFREHDPTHFKHLPMAMLTLFQVVTLEGWAGIMLPLMEARQGFAVLAVPAYFVSFILFGTMILLNLFIGVIMNSMTEAHTEIAHQERDRHVHQTGSPTLDDELQLLEEQIEALRKQSALIRSRVAAGKG